MTVIEIFFWLSALTVFWTYIGYFLFLKLISLIYTRKVNRKEIYPQISVIITSYNEERRIRQKLDNTLSLTYPKDKLEIIVVSDASTDRTEDIVREYEDRGVRLLVIPERHGKHYGQGRGIRMAKSDIVVCSDATTFLPTDSVRRIVSNFADPSIGCVSSRDQVIGEDGKIQGEGIYVRYEMALRDLESEVGSLVGLSGSFFAVRKKLTAEWVDNMSSDFYTPIVTRKHGYRAIADPEAVGHYRVQRSPQKEFERKVRTVVHGLEVLFRFSYILNPFKYGAFSLQVISHKLLRWLVPFSLIALFGLNTLLLDEGVVYRISMALQITFYILVSIALLFEKLQERTAFMIPAFFVMVNLSILVAWYKYLTGQEYTAWTATKR
jgi:cellulose synthase/poly-beta-1,6-N-acetylglucosamine synthase-like glycosyltransferase